MDQYLGHGKRRQRYSYPVGVPVSYPVAVEQPCACKTETQGSSGFEQKIKENPIVFVLGALAVGYLLAKNR